MPSRPAPSPPGGSDPNDVLVNAALRRRSGVVRNVTSDHGRTPVARKRGPEGPRSRAHRLARYGTWTPTPATVLPTQALGDVETTTLPFTPLWV
jgi:hypothetical protein